MHKKETSPSRSPTKNIRQDLSFKNEVKKQEVEEYETVLEKSFEICDSKGAESDWISLRVMGKLPPKRANHSLCINDER